MSLPVALTQGTVVGGHYIIGSLLNSGGFGAVYRGIDTSEGNRPCAIKETYDVTPSARRQALMEASVLFTVRSPHLPEVYDAFENNGRFYLVMQLIEGQNLLQLLRTRVPYAQVGEAQPYRQATGPCTEQEVLSWLLPIMDVLQELHGRNPPIMHRDIKPGNIILTPQQTAVLVDFGLTKLYDPNRGSQSLVKAITEGFSPIEQYMGQTCPQSDIYSLAATMYLLLTNKLPPSSVNRSMRDELLPPRQFNPALSPATEQALLKALSIYADQRYRSMREFAQALRGMPVPRVDQTLASSPAPLYLGHSDPTLAARPIPAYDSHSEPTIGAFSVPAYPSVDPTRAARPTPAYPLQSSSGSFPPPPPSYPSASTTNMYPTVPPTPAPYTGASAAIPAVPAAPQYPPAARPTSSPSHPAHHRGAKGKGTAPGAKPGQQPAHPARPATPAKPVHPVSHRPLPRPATQGCLWGLIQGVLAAVLILYTKKDVDFYLATAMGFLFYLIAGWVTTRRGGSSFRGAKAGYWAGIYSTIFFWVSLGIGLAIQFMQLNQKLSSPTQAWKEVLPMWPQVAILPTQPLIVNYIVVLLMGVVAAWFLGWIGGLCGSFGYRTGTTQQS